MENSIIGPFTSIAENSVVTGSIIRDTILHNGVHIVDAMLGHSLIGSKARIKGSGAKLNVGDDSQVEVE